MPKVSVDVRVRVCVGVRVPHPTNRATTDAPSRQALHKGEVVLIEERGGVAVVSDSNTVIGIITFTLLV